MRTLCGKPSTNQRWTKCHYKRYTARKMIPVEARHREPLKREIEYMLKHRIIEECTSEYASNVVIADKPNGKIRVCANFGPLNDITPKDRYPMPNMREQMNQFEGMEWFSIFDASKGYWQFRIKPEHRKYTAIITEGGQYQYLVMPFGLCNASAIFQRYMNKTFRKQIGSICLIYIDDIVIYSKTLSDHIKYVNAILEIMQQKNIYINREVLNSPKRDQVL